MGKSRKPLDTRRRQIEQRLPDFDPDEFVPPGGVIRQYYDWARPTGAAPDEFLLFGGLSVLSAVVQGRVAVERGLTGLHLHSHVLFVGAGPRAFRSTAMEHMSEVLLDLQTRTGKCIGGPISLDDWQPGILLSRLWQESSTHLLAPGLLRASARSGKLAWLLADVCDECEVAGAADGNLGQAAWLSTCVPTHLEEMMEYLSVRPLCESWMPRCLLVAPSPAHSDRYYGMDRGDVDEAATEQLVSWLAELDRRLPAANGDRRGGLQMMTLSDAARDALAPWLKELERDLRSLSESHGNGPAMYVAAYRDHVLRIAALLEISMGGLKQISARAAEMAISICDHQLHVLTVLLDLDGSDACLAAMQRVIRVIEARRGGSVSRRQLLRSAGVRAAELDQILSRPDVSAKLRQLQVEVTGEPRPGARGKQSR